MYVHNWCFKGDDDDECFHRLHPAPLLDALSKETQKKRRALAMAALSKRELEIMRDESVASVEKELNDGHTGWTRPSIEALHRQRLREIRQMQASTDACLPLGPVERLIRTIVNDFKSDTAFAFTAEAMDCIKCCLECYLVGLSRDANL